MVELDLRTDNQQDACLKGIGLRAEKNSAALDSIVDTKGGYSPFVKRIDIS